MNNNGARKGNTYMDAHSNRTALDNGRRVTITASLALIALCSAFARASLGLDTWSTVDEFFLAPTSTSSRPHAITSSMTGDIYVGGVSANDSGPYPWIVRKSSDGGASWTTEDTFQYVPTHSARVYGMISDASGAVYAVGGADNGLGGQKWIVRKFSAGTWATVDDFGLASDNSASARGAAVSPDGSLFVVGGATPTASIAPKWIVRRSEDGGATWTTVDAFQAAVDKHASAHSVSVDSNGRVFVSGFAVTKANANGGNSWVVRRSTNNGGTWTTVDTYTPGKTVSASGRSLTIDSSGSILVSGLRTDRHEAHWIVRKSTTGNSGSWTNVDDYQYDSTSWSQATAITTDPSGVVFVTGTATAGSVNHWVVRKSLDGGSTWSISDDFVHGGSAEGLAIVDTPSGVFSAGRGYTGSVHNWIVRRLTPNLMQLVRPPVSFTRGDANSDGLMDLSDAIFMLSLLLLGDPATECLRAADLDGNESLDLADVVYGLNYHFLGGLPPVQPFPDCGAGAGATLLSCEGFAGCP